MPGSRGCESNRIPDAIGRVCWGLWCGWNVRKTGVRGGAEAFGQVAGKMKLPKLPFPETEDHVLEV